MRGILLAAGVGMAGNGDIKNLPASFGMEREVCEWILSTVESCFASG